MRTPTSLIILLLLSLLPLLALALASPGQGPASVNSGIRNKGSESDDTEAPDAPKEQRRKNDAGTPLLGRMDWSVVLGVAGVVGIAGGLV